MCIFRCNENYELVQGEIQSSPNRNVIEDVPLTHSTESDIGLLLNSTEGNVTLEDNANVVDSSANHSSDFDIEELKTENKKLKQEVEKLNKRMRQQEKLARKEIQIKVYEILKPIFTTGQINKQLHPTKSNIKWSPEDIASAIALRSVT